MNEATFKDNLDDLKEQGASEPRWRLPQHPLRGPSFTCLLTRLLTCLLTPDKACLKTHFVCHVLFLPPHDGAVGEHSNPAESCQDCDLTLCTYSLLRNSHLPTFLLCRHLLANHLCLLILSFITCLIMSMIRARPSPQSSYLGLDFGNVLTSAPRPAPEFYARNNGPIPRHDNDYSNFQTVEILPTADEILAVGKPVYMPKRNLLEPNPMLAGVDRLLDLSFRQLRYESVEAIRDICYSAAQTSFLGSHTQSYSRQTTYVSRTSDLALKQDNVGQLEPRQETPLGNRYFLYQGIQVEELLSHETKSVLIRLSFDCPPFMRGRKIHHAGRFEEGMLVALLCLDTSANILDVYYLQVHALQSTDSMKGRGGQGCKAAVLASFLSDTPRAVVYQFAKFAQKLCPNVEMSLVEIPNLLYAGFGPCLSRLQKLRDFAFSELVAPSMAMQMMRININHRETYGRTSIQPCQPPRYAQESGFEFHLAPIIKPGTAVGVSSYTLGEVADSNSTAMIESMTSLDTGQAAALRHSLLSSFAFTQGPPGTGKVFSLVLCDHLR